MCGIAGFEGQGNEDVLSQMNAVQRHRGPDDSGQKIFVSRSGNGKTLGLSLPRKAGLAHSRLSIIDVSAAGHQPLSNEDGTIWVAFNGEIYNFKELKGGLGDRHIFKSRTDTEVIVHLYEELGVEAFSKMQGMFAIAIYDSKKGHLILARDRMGKKPLYWGIYGGTFLFGSELKALMEHPSFGKEIDMESLAKYLQFEYVPTPHSIFKDTWKLEPGTYLIWDGKSAKKHMFWTPTFLPKEDSWQRAIGDLDKNLEMAVSDRMVADVPVGVFLSGGLDSSTVAYYSSKARKDKIKTFSIGFKEASFDESKYARQAAGFLGTEHYEKIFSVEDCLDIVEDVVARDDEPLADASLLPTYLLSRFAREHVTVALGGDGGDELFAGYDTFLAHRMAGLYSLIPSSIRKSLIGPLVNALPSSHSNMSFDFRAKKFVNGFEGKEEYRDQRWLGAFGADEIKKILYSEAGEMIGEDRVFEDIDSYIRQTDSKDFYDRLGLLYERMYMMDQVLVKVDRASMMNSLEVRTPFLDTRVVDLANHMPSNFKFRGLTRKYILKKLMENKLPNEIVYRKKKGFGIPVAQWINGGLKPLVLDQLGKASLDDMGLFDAKEVSGLLQSHFAGKKDNRKQIWTLLVFSIWWRRWMK